MRNQWFIAAAVWVSVVCLYGCGGTEFVNTAELPDTYQCRHFKEVLKEARDFENVYGKLSGDEKTDAENVLKAYRLQCKEALDACRKSAGRSR